MTSTTGAERAQDAASTAADRGQDVAATAADEARNVAGEAQQKAKDVVGEAREQVSSHLGEQTTAQRDRLVTTLHGVGGELDTMADAGSGVAADLAREAADRARQLTGWLDGREPADLLGDVRQFARRRPGTFLLGALAAGVVVGRLARGARDAQQDSGTAGLYNDVGSTTPVPAPPTTPATPPTPAGGTGTPVLPPEPVVPAAPAPPGPTPGSGLGTDAAGYGERPITPGGPA